VVTGGTFNRINDVNYPATVSDFNLDKYEVTVGRFRKFKTAWDGGWRPASGAGKHTHLNSGAGLVNTTGTPSNEPGWDATWNATVDPSDANLTCNATYATWTTSAGANETRPVTCVNWQESYAFCIWDGGFLPSEAEWNYAAAGGGDASGQRVYPWSVPSSSTTISPTYASYYVDSTQQCMGDGENGCTLADLINVGTKPSGNGRYGQSDLAGNVREWNLDWYGTLTGLCNNCAYFPEPPPASRVPRGGSFNIEPSYLLSSYRFFYSPGTRNYGNGLRCARTP
jgi:formylglycine-generating enzyme required for sulfatase activity